MYSKQMQLHKPRNNTKRSKRITKEERQAYAECVKDMRYCQLCGSYHNLHIHHIRFGSMGRKTYRGNLIRLCIHCHNMVHKNDKKYRPILIDMVDKIYGGKNG